MKRKIALFLICLFAVIYVSAQKVGDKAQILWNNKWYPGKILEVKDGKYYISYDGYDAKWNEWVGSDRLKLSSYVVGDKVQVLWKGTWYKSTILETNREGKYKIHYDGWGAQWDEWVTPDRMKK